MSRRGIRLLMLACFTTLSAVVGVTGYQVGRLNGHVESLRARALYALDRCDGIQEVICFADGSERKCPVLSSDSEFALLASILHASLERRGSYSSFWAADERIELLSDGHSSE